jgi:hypothetical protein
MKTCIKCQSVQPLEEFVKDKRRSDGRGSWCVSCNRAYLNAYGASAKGQAARRSHYESNKRSLTAQNRARWAEKKNVYKVAGDAWRAEHRDDLLVDQKRRGSEHRAFIDALKAGIPCLDCGEVLPPYCMEYDHVRGEKRFALGKMANHRREAVLEEIAKCELVCCACHRVRTQTRKGASRIPRLQAFREWLNSLKAHPCTDCGRVRQSVAMDFDHIDDDKVAGIAQMWSWSRVRVIAEIAKCELVCCICHRIRTQTRMSEKVAA